MNAAFTNFESNDCVCNSNWEMVEILAGATGLEPAASCVTGRRSNHLNCAPAFQNKTSALPTRSSNAPQFLKLPAECRDSTQESRN